MHFWRIKTRPKTWPTRWNFWIHRYLEINISDAKNLNNEPRNIYFQQNYSQLVLNTSIHSKAPTQINHSTYCLTGTLHRSRPTDPSPHQSLYARYTSHQKIVVFHFVDYVMSLIDINEVMNHANINFRLL